MTAELDWLKTATSAIGAVGGILGFYSFWENRKTRKESKRKAFAIAVMLLDSITAKLLSLPLATPSDFLSCDRSNLASQLGEIEESLHDAQENLLGLVPDIASNIVSMQRRSEELRKQLHSSTDTAACLRAAEAYLEAAHHLSVFRSLTPHRGFRLDDQQPPTVQNYYGDDTVMQMAERWLSFNRHNRTNGLSGTAGATP